MACVVSSSLVVSRRLSSSLVVCRHRRVSNSRPFGEAFASDCCMDVSRVSSRRYYIVICMTMTCRARNVMHFAAQAQRFVRSAVCCAAPLGLAFGESCFWGVGCGCAIGICVSGCGVQARFSREVSAEMTILVDGSVLRMGQNHSKRVVRCKFC